MARFLTRLSMGVWLQAAFMTIITMATGLVIFYGTLSSRFGIADDAGGTSLRLQLDDVPMLLLVMAISTGIGGGLSTFFVHRITRPIAAVAQAAARVADGEQGVRIDQGKARGETAGLIAHFNQMAGAMDIYERERSVLTAGVAHELRTPLTILKGRLHGLRDGVIEPDSDEADRLLRQVDHLLRVVGDMGTLALADAGRLTLDMQRVDLVDIVRSAASDMTPLIVSLGIELEEIYRSATVWGDPLRLTQVITNLLTNAIRHAPTGSAISVAVCVESGRACVSVADEGPGFGRKDGGQLFIPFWRSGTKGRSGSGLGLALCAMMTEAQGGCMEADNRTDRSGTRFTMSLPLLQDGRGNPA
jgi:two-component system sensor histidine kinase AdeS